MTKQETQKLHKKLVEYILRHPEQTYTDMSIQFGISLPAISKIARAHGIERRSSFERFSVTEELFEKLEK